MANKKICFYIFLTISILINVFILVESAFGYDSSSSQSIGVTQAFIDLVAMINPNSSIVTNPELTHAVIRKLIGHFAFFGLSGVFTTLTFVFIEEEYSKHKLESIIMLVTTGFLVALISELIQLLTPGRFFAFTDVLIDLSGFIVFGGVTYLIGYLIYNKKERKNNASSLG